MTQTITKHNVIEAAQYINERVQIMPDVLGVVLGSGFGGLVDSLENVTSVDYADVPNMVRPTVSMHEGRFCVGYLGDRQLVCMQGRLHAYEGNSAQQIAFPICILHQLGADELVITNAAGGINEGFEVGDLMLIEDHINLLMQNPCAGPEQADLWPRFFDMTNAYDRDLRERAIKAARSCGIAIKSGVYIATLGPSFETPAEIRAFRTLGADAVGMSTIYEVIAANALGMKVLGISMISNPAAGMQADSLSIEDVAQAAGLASTKANDFLKAFIER
jgi:purine-nucleoside phosphorylase